MAESLTPQTRSASTSASPPSPSPSLSLSPLLNSESSTSSISLSSPLDTFLSECADLFSQDQSQLLSLSNQLVSEYGDHLETGSVTMLPSFNHTLPSGQEVGQFLCVDVGGSTLRVGMVRLNGCGKNILSPQDPVAEILFQHKFVIDDTVRALDLHPFFDWMAQCITESLTSTTTATESGPITSPIIPAGLSWSFALGQTSIRSGRVLEMGKGFVAGQQLQDLDFDLTELVTQACARKGTMISIRAIVNDSTATLLSHAYRDPSSRMAVIVGTGLNAGIYAPIESVSRSRFAISTLQSEGLTSPSETRQRPQTWFNNAEGVIINTELGFFGKSILPITRWDRMVNECCARPDLQPFEYLVGGRYIGEIVRLVCEEGINEHGLFSGSGIMSASDSSPDWARPYGVTTEIIAEFAALASSSSALPPITDSDTAFVAEISALVAKRAATFVAVALHALLRLDLYPKSSSIPLTNTLHTPLALSIGCDGSVIERFPRFKEVCESVLNSLLALQSTTGPTTVTLCTISDASIIGAAVAAACADAYHSKEQE